MSMNCILQKQQPRILTIYPFLIRFRYYLCISQKMSMLVKIRGYNKDYNIFIL